ncbi:hypothetical protein C41B8_17858 [Salinisphaera hydrothermalis C41B8]|uniref:Uncharacterized protein n=2 Tax=Salinisphaera TaxID=180541 RepID=A0A084IGM6_SALHC|nr:hypothetical protein C41B8_17858 [Salinisphaera hydrothermalis C41B8]
MDDPNIDERRRARQDTRAGTERADPIAGIAAREVTTMAQDRNAPVPGWQGRQLQQAKLELEARRRRLREAANTWAVQPTSGAASAGALESVQ